jgi:hypothetical protein
MPDDDNEQQLDDDTPVTIAAKDLKALRNIARSASETAAQAAAAQRELAFARAKIDVTDPKMSYFIKGYEGDLEPDKIRTAAQEAGFISTDSHQVQIPAGELQGHQQMGAASAGANSKPEDLTEKIRNAQSQEEVMAIMMAAGYPTSWTSQ